MPQPGRRTTVPEPTDEMIISVNLMHAEAFLIQKAFDQVSPAKAVTLP